MKLERIKTDFYDLLRDAGIHVNGSNPWDIKVHNELFYPRVIGDGSLGAGEAYIDGWWDCRQLDEFFSRILSADLEMKTKTSWRLFTDFILTKLFNHQTRPLAFKNGKKHYDLGNDLFQCMLDRRLTYSCAYWKDATTLDEAQEKKLDLICRKVSLEPGMEVLDIGCGWGSFAKFAAEKYGVSVTGITVSPEQVELGRKLCRDLPVEIKLEDYRQHTGKYDCIVSIGMFEHVGFKNYKKFMQVVHRCLKEDGLFLLHTIGGNVSVTSIDPWLDRYIFPGAMLPSIKQIGAAIERLFVMEDWHNFSADYDRTLVAWHDNFVRNWDAINGKYDQRFYRLWTYYLLMCAGSFRSRKNQLWQIVLSKNGVTGGYISVR